MLSGAALPGAAGARPGLDSLYHDARPAMGTIFEAYLYAASQPRAAELFEVAFEEIERLEAGLSTYRPTSELSRINSQATRGPVTTAQATRTFPGRW